MKAKEELTKLIMESYDRGVKDTKQEALTALEKIVAVNNTCEKHCEATAFKITIRGLEHKVAEEREACAKLVESLPAPDIYSNTDRSMWDITCMDCASAIRARGNT
jgi:hypothetical protein